VAWIVGCKERKIKKIESKCDKEKRKSDKE
jgi:hypothetical protein